jgi:branched-chain amino acid transport system ATP-binding protein
MSFLKVEKLTKSFGGLVAVNDVTCTLHKGIIMGLIGPNGSGKTTLFNLITGFIQPTTGKIEFDGNDITGATPQEICRCGIARTFQLNKLFNSMTVTENIMMGRLYGNEPVRKLKHAKIESEEFLELTGLQNKRGLIAGSLGMVDRRRLEVARALATKPKMLFLDEVMAGLNFREIEETMTLLRNLRNAGITMMVVEHIMKALMGISDFVIVLSAGNKIAEGTPDEVICNEEVVKAYLGEDDDA